MEQACSSLFLRRPFWMWGTFYMWRIGYPCSSLHLRHYPHSGYSGLYWWQKVPLLAAVHKRITAQEQGCPKHGKVQLDLRALSVLIGILTWKRECPGSCPSARDHFSLLWNFFKREAEKLSRFDKEFGGQGILGAGDLTLLHGRRQWI